LLANYTAFRRRGQQRPGRRGLPDVPSGAKARSETPVGLAPGGCRCLDAALRAGARCSCSV